VGLVKDAKLKVQAAIQEAQVRITGKNKDDLQSAIRLLREQDLGIDLQFVNFRD
jgi:cyclic-di-GMP-binding protein